MLTPADWKSFPSYQILTLFITGSVDLLVNDTQITNALLTPNEYFCDIWCNNYVFLSFKECDSLSISSLSKVLIVLNKHKLWNFNEHKYALNNICCDSVKVFSIFENLKPLFVRNAYGTLTIYLIIFSSNIVYLRK